MQRLIIKMQTVFANRIPTRDELKGLIRKKKWSAIGHAFGFTPTFDSFGEVDWRAMPDEFYKVYGVEKETLAFLKESSGIGLVFNRTGKRVAYFKVQKRVCHYCRRATLFENWTIDHKTPLARGGSNRKENCVGACKECNAVKSCLTEAEFMSTNYGWFGKYGGDVDLKELVKNVQDNLRSGALTTGYEYLYTTHKPNG